MKKQVLRSGRWFKLICGASYQDLPTIRNLALVYSLAGADCVDVASDPAVIRVAQAGIDRALELEPTLEKPLLMASINDGQDPHFRKATFDPNQCLTNCKQPCVAVCPTHAIAKDGQISPDLCYGCGRCLAVCPVQIITAQAQIYHPSRLVHTPIQALEIHTQVDRVPEFRQMWQNLQLLLPQLQLISISCGDGQNLEAYFQQLLTIMDRSPQTLIWQTDGRPMSGDIGAGTTLQALQLAQKVLKMNLPRGFVQLAGGTNQTTVAKANAMGIKPNGYAYGSYARQLVADMLMTAGDNPLEKYPKSLDRAVITAKELVDTVKNTSVNGIFPPKE